MKKRLGFWVGIVAVALGFGWWGATRPERSLMRFSVDLGPAAVEGVNITVAISPTTTTLYSGGTQQAM